MKNCIIFFALLLVIMGCNKAVTTENKEKHFKAGTKDPNLVNYKNVPQNTFTFDVNKDVVNDILFSFGVGNSPSFTYLYTKLTTIDSSIEIATTPDSTSPITIEENQIIDDKLLWLSKPTKSIGKEFLLAVSSSYYPTHSFYNYENWLNKTAYVGIRKKEKNGRYKYGWFKLSVKDYYQTTLHEYAFMK
ncbi:MAG: hypothetical protein NTX03_15465 [Bacteroidetes bacterium]|nr:hypothetical protein [Bacteroidota bacterium]